jgi:arsenate reductase (thioredoxin)
MSGSKKTVCFICVHNSCRSQMAEAFAAKLGRGSIEAYSAGTDIGGKVDPFAVRAMKEEGIDISGARPKSMDDVPPRFDVLVTMGCGAKCPLISSGRREDWAIEDPSGKDIGRFRETRDIIREKVCKLIEDINGGGSV